MRQWLLNIHLMQALCIACCLLLGAASSECGAGLACVSEKDTASLLQLGFHAEDMCKHQSLQDGMHSKHFVEAVYYFLGANSPHGINPKLSGVLASPAEDAAKNFVMSQLDEWVRDGVYTMNDLADKDWRTQVVPESLPKLTARIELLQHMYALRHAWVALSSLHGEKAEKQRQHLKHLYSKVPEEHPFVSEDNKVIVRSRLELAQELRNALISPALLPLLDAAKSCFLPHDHHLFGNHRQLSQRSRVRPVGPLTKDSVILLSEPDGSITEKDDLKMPMMTLGTGYGDCYKGKIVHYPAEDPYTGVLTEKPCSQYYPEAGFYRDAVKAGIKGIDTAFIYGTEEQIGREAPDVFITTKSMTAPFRKMLGVLHGTDKMVDQLRALKRTSVNVLYNHEDGEDDNEWRLLEEEIPKGHARALGASDVSAALEHEQCVKDGKCNIHVSAVQEEISPCGTRFNKVLQLIMDKEELFGNATLVGHSAIYFCQNEPITESIAKRLGRTVAEVAIRANLEQGIPMLAQTRKPEHMRQELAVFDFSLSPGDLSQILLNLELYRVHSKLFKE